MSESLPKPMDSQINAPPWATLVLRAAAVYNVVWGAAVIVAPMALFRWAGMDPPRYPSIWQCVGMIVGVYGVGYWLASRDPFRHWPLVLVGLLGKVLGPIGFVHAALQGALPWRWGLTIVTNDLIWWLPFGAILYLAFRHHSRTAAPENRMTFRQAIRWIRSQRNSSLLEISSRQPTLVVFLRHAGCTFCREALAELGRQREAIERRGVAIAIVHMGRPMDGTLMLQQHGLLGVHHFSDPQCQLYEALGVGRARFIDVFSPSVWFRGFEALVRGHGFGSLAGDAFRMPATFLLDRGRVVDCYRSETVADRPNYLLFACRVGSIGNRTDHAVVHA